MDSISTTAATPMIIPSIVKPVRNRLRRSARSASPIMANKFRNPPYCHVSPVRLSVALTGSHTLQYRPHELLTQW